MTAGDAFRALMDNRPIRRDGWPDGCYIRRVETGEALPAFVPYGDEAWCNRYRNDMRRVIGDWRTDDWELHL